MHVGTSLAIWFALAGAVAAAPKIAFVQADRVYRALDTTKALDAEVEQAREEMLANPRFAAFEESVEELRELQSRLAAAAELDRSSRERALREFSNKHREVESLESEMNEFRRERTLEINRMKVRRMREILGNIRRAVEVIGREDGYDLVLDISGKTNTGLPLVLYSRETDDITTRVLAAFGHPVEALEGEPSN